MRPDDLEPDELELHALLSRVPPTAPPLGLRERVMSRLEDRRVLWEWIVAALFAVPSLVYLSRLVLVHGNDFLAAIGNVLTAASATSSDASFFVDGAAVLALALLGTASAVAAHALFVSDTRRGGVAR
jgi:hypothetical protein